jgi:hypothetical protein
MYQPGAHTGGTEVKSLWLTRKSIPTTEAEWEAECEAQMGQIGQVCEKIISEHVMRGRPIGFDKPLEQKNQIENNIAGALLYSLDQLKTNMHEGKLFSSVLWAMGIGRLVSMIDVLREDEGMEKWVHDLCTKMSMSRNSVKSKHRKADNAEELFRSEAKRIRSTHPTWSRNKIDEEVFALKIVRKKNGEPMSLAGIKKLKE